jgi:hypothetical protein
MSIRIIISLPNRAQIAHGIYKYASQIEVDIYSYADNNEKTAWTSGFGGNMQQNLWAE